MFRFGKIFKSRKRASKGLVMPIVCAVLFSCAIGVGVWLTSVPVAESAVVSGGIQCYANSAYLAAAAPVGESIDFDAAWFITLFEKFTD